MLEIRLLGQFEIRLGGAPVDLPSRPAQSLCAYLLLNPGVAHRRERLAGLLWPEATDANSRGYLRKALWQLRKAIPPDPASGRDYWRVDDLSLAFEATAGHWLDTAILDQPGEAAGLAAQMERVAVYRGELLPGFYDEWVELERERLQAVFEQQMQHLLESLLAAQAWPAVLEWGERWIALGGAPEPAYRALMLARGQQGDGSGVAAVYQRCVEALARELGVEPSAQTQAVYAQLSSRGMAVQAEGAAWPAALASPLPAASPDDPGPAPGPAPFMGLHYFEPADSDLFFGREQLTASLIERLQAHPFLAIVGASGSGKSSLVRAGLVAARQRTTPPGTAPPAAFLLTPTAQPLEALARCLAGEDGPPAVALVDDLARDPSMLLFFLRHAVSAAGGPQVLFIVDQFEELFTLCRSEVERQAFLDNLLTAAAAGDAPAQVVITLRADFYGHCAQYPDLRAALAEHQAYIGPMSAAELRRAMEGPAHLGGWEFEPGLVDWILREAGSEPGGLPLLSHALLETWQRRRGHTLTFQGYAACGGVPGAIAKTAETVFNHTLTPEQQPLARQIFLRLTELGEGTQDTRRRATLAELIPQSDQAQAAGTVLKILVDARLVTVDHDTAEVGHEALIREWPALRQWLAEDRDGLRLERRLSEAAQDWEALERDPGALWRGARLNQTLEWASEHPGSLNPLEREFLTTAQAQVAGEAAENAARQQRELEATRRLAAAERQRADESGRAALQLRRRAAYLVGAVVLALLLAGAALWLGSQARQAAVTAQANERVALARELAAAAITNLDVDPERSVLLALQAVTETYTIDRSATTEAVEALHSALQVSRVERTVALGAEPAVAVAFSPDGKLWTTTSRQGLVTVWDRGSGAARLTLATQSGPDSHALAFSPNGARLATSGPDGTAEVWDVASGHLMFALTGHTAAVLAIAFSADGARLATASADGTARIWDAVTGAGQYTVLGHAGALDSVAFSPEGTRLATASVDGAMNVWEVAASRPLHLFTGANATSVAFSPDGKQLLTASGATATIWDAWGGQALRTLNLVGHTGQVLDVAVGPDGTRLATGSLDRKAIIWDAVTGQPLLTLAGNNGAVEGVAFSPDGAHLATASDDGTARIWNIGLSQEWFTQPLPSGSTGRMAMSPDGKLLAMGVGASPLVEIWDAASGQMLSALTDTTTVRAVAFDPAGTRLATAGTGTLHIWDSGTGQVLLSPLAPAGTIQDMAFSHTGNRLVTVGATGTAGTAQIWEVASGQPTVALASPAPLLSVAFSPDDQRLAAGGADGLTRIWEAATGAMGLTLTSTSAVRAVAFSPSGAQLATATDGGVTQIWDLASGQVAVTLSGHTSLVMGVAFSADGQRVATASRDGTAKLWDPRSGQLLLTLPGSGRGLNGVAFSPDGARLITSGDDGLRAYVLPVETLVALAHTRVTRGFTLAECQLYLHLAQCPVTVSN